MTESVQVIGWEDFTRVQLCAGTVLRVEPFPEARRPAWKLWVDFGPHGVKKTSAQIRALYAPEDLVGRQIVGVLNFPPKQVGALSTGRCNIIGVAADREGKCDDGSTWIVIGAEAGTVDALARRCFVQRDCP